MNEPTIIRARKASHPASRQAKQTHKQIKLKKKPTKQIVVALVAWHDASLGHVLALSHGDVRPREVPAGPVGLMPEKPGDTAHR